jgi:hypothetical protein
LSLVKRRSSYKCSIASDAVGRVLVKKWWNGRWGRLARRDVLVWTTEDRGRWMVEVRDGGAEGRSRFKEASSEHEVFALAMQCRNESPEDEWKDISLLIRNPPKRDDHG